jgi:hypothetical protein
MSNSSNRLIIFDTTLRDGEQSPGASMTKDEKVRIAKQLERLRVDVIEAGFAAASQGDFESIKAIASVVRESTICSLSRANDRDIARAAEALAPAVAQTHPHLHRHLEAAHGDEAAHAARPGAAAGAERRALRPPVHRRHRIQPGRRQPLGRGFPVPRTRRRDRRGRHHDQLPRHGRLRGAGDLRRDHPPPARAHPQFRQGGLVGALP